MKKRVAALLLTGIMAVGMLSGCGKSFDATSYTKAYLDTTFKNDSTEFVNGDFGTKEEAEELYTENLDDMVEESFGALGLSGEIVDGYKESFRNMFNAVKYTVGDASKKDDSYEVEIKYQKLLIFATCMETYNEKLTEWTNEMSAMSSEELEAMDEDAILEKSFELLKESLDDALDNATYEEEATTTVTVAKNSNGQYEISESEAEELFKVLIDLDAMNQ